MTDRYRSRREPSGVALTRTYAVRNPKESVTLESMITGLRGSLDDRKELKQNNKSQDEECEH